MIRKDVFIVHNRDSLIERRTSRDLAAWLEGVGYSRCGDADFGRRHEDPAQEVDYELLLWVLEHTRLFVLLNPTAKPSPIMMQALRLLRNPRTRSKMQDRPFLLCGFDDAPLHACLRDIAFTSRLNIRPLPSSHEGLRLALRLPMPPDVLLAFLSSMALLLAYPLLRPGELPDRAPAHVDKKRVLKGLCQVADGIENDILNCDQDRLRDPSLVREAISLCDSLTPECDWSSTWPAEAADLAAEMRGRLGAWLFAKN